MMRHPIFPNHSPLNTMWKTKKRATAPSVDSLSYDAELYELLRQRRNELAAEEGVPPYVILDNKTLMHMAEIQPQTREEFLMVRGIGMVRMERYASSFLSVILAYHKSKSGETFYKSTATRSDPAYILVTEAKSSGTEKKPR